MKGCCHKINREFGELMEKRFTLLTTSVILCEMLFHCNQTNKTITERAKIPTVKFDSRQHLGGEVWPLGQMCQSRHSLQGQWWYEINGWKTWTYKLKTKKLKLDLMHFVDVHWQIKKILSAWSDVSQKFEWSWSFSPSKFITYLLQNTVMDYCESFKLIPLKKYLMVFAVSRLLGPSSNYLLITTPTCWMMRLWGISFFSFFFLDRQSSISTWASLVREQQSFNWYKVQWYCRSFE